jgi:uncharacterized membrane protein
MVFCGNCGAALTQTSGFCGSCGKPAFQGSPVASTAAGPAAQSITGLRQPTAGSSGLTSNLAAALSYVLGIITGILFLVIEPYKNDRFVRFHAMQSCLYFSAVVVFNIAWMIVVGVLSDFSGWLALATLPIRILISLGFFLLWLYAIYQAYSQREFRIPFIGAIAAKQMG